MKLREAKLRFTDGGPEDFEEEVTVTIVLEFTCPFCYHRRKCAVGLVDNDDTKPVGVHETPHCDEFEGLDLVEYMRAARLMGARPVSEPN
jgi:hypothetical protein